MAAGVLLVVGGWYGYRWWQSEQSEKSLAAEARFTAMLEALTQNNRAEGLKIGGEIATDYRGTPYADQAALVLARMDVEGGDFAQAESRLARVAGIRRIRTCGSSRSCGSRACSSRRASTTRRWRRWRRRVSPRPRRGSRNCAATC